jgi:hypothetical protein
MNFFRKKSKKKCQLIKTVKLTKKAEGGEK